MSASAAAAMSSRRVQAASVPNSGSSSNGSSVGSSSAAATPTLRRGHSLDDSLPPAEEQGRYERMRVLGRGAFGAVTLVKDSTDSHLYAMKTLNWSEKEETRKAAMVEISLLRKLKHPFVVNLYDTFVSSDGRLVCMAMTYCESGDLSKVRHGVAVSGSETLGSTFRIPYKMTDRLSVLQGHYACSKVKSTLGREAGLVMVCSNLLGCSLSPEGLEHIASRYQTQ